MDTRMSKRSCYLLCLPKTLGDGAMPTALSRRIWFVIGKDLPGSYRQNAHLITVEYQPFKKQFLYSDHSHPNP